VSAYLAKIQGFPGICYHSGVHLPWVCVIAGKTRQEDLPMRIMVREPLTNTFKKKTVRVDLIARRSTFA
jgi:hypothetical protein